MAVFLFLRMSGGLDETPVFDDTAQLRRTAQRSEAGLAGVMAKGPNNPDRIAARARLPLNKFSVFSVQCSVFRKDT